jgi:PAS domain S-box-containing protein
MNEKTSYEDLVKRVKDLETEAEENKQAEKVLKHTEKAFSQIIHGSPIPTFVINNKHTVTHWNRACENLTGVPANEITGTRKQWLAFYSAERPVMADFIVDKTPEEKIARYYGKKYRISAVAEGAYEAEDFFPDLGKKGKWLFFTAAPLKNSKGRLIGAIETLQDFTDRNLAEGALRLDESRLEALLEFSQMAGASLNKITDFALEKAVMLTKSKIGYLAFMNEDETDLTMHSWSGSAIEKSSIIDEPSVYPLDKTGLWEEAVRQRKPIINNDYSAPDPFKKVSQINYFLLNRHMNIPVFEGDRIVAVAGVGDKKEGYDGSDVRQLTLLMQGMWRFVQRKRADEELKKHRDHLEELVQQRSADLIQSEEKYRTLVENVPLVVYRMSTNGEILFVNHFVEELFGYNITEIFHNPDLWNKSIYDEDRVRVENLWEESFREGKEFFAEYRIKHKTGHIVHVTDHAIPFRTTDGLISSVDGIIMDVTGRIQLQEELIRAEGLRTVSEVSNRLAHEIRNPLVSAGGFARRILSSMSQDDPNRAKVEIIVKEVGRLETILRMMLAYIQPLELQMSRTDPNQLVERALSSVDMEIKERNLRVDIQLDPGLPIISIDRPQMELAVETLIKKAVNQMQESATLLISSYQENKMFRLVIRYPVQHMSSDDVEGFFYPFTTSQIGYDTVDLPMTKILVLKHGGVVDVRLEGSGKLTIHLSLPL